MSDLYKQMYKELIEAYYNKTFEETYKRLQKNFKDKEEAKEVFSALAGVDNVAAKNDHEFIQKLLDAITKNRVRENIVCKVTSCDKDCESEDGNSKCQNVCPFNAIKRDAVTQDKYIDYELCMSCGRCVEACDLGHYMDIPQFLPLANLLKEGEKVVAMIAPAIIGQFGEDVTLDQLREAFIKIGFTDMVEVAMGADVLSLKEALEFDHMVKDKDDFMITSCCCPVWVAALKRVYYDLIPEVSPSVSPMVAMARIVKKLNPDAKTVFIGPCIAKKSEAKERDLVGDVDYVLTFQEVQAIFEALKVEPAKLNGVPTVDYAATGGRLYARAGGVSEAVWDVVDQLFPKKRELFTSVNVDGMVDCKAMLNDLLEGKKKASFIEGMACKGGCVGGPKRIIPVEDGTEAANKEAYSSPIKIPFHGEITNELLRKVGILDLNALRDDHSMFERSFKE